MAAKRGANLVLAARNKDALMQLTEEIQGQGGNAEPIQGDVGCEEDIGAIVKIAQDRFGGFDTWINMVARFPQRRTEERIRSVCL